MTLTAAPEIYTSGLVKHLVPRFSLKTGVRITIADDGDLMITAGQAGGVPVMTRGDTVFAMTAPRGAAAQRFADWLLSDVGRRTIDSFKPASGAAFVAYTAQAVEAVEASFSGDAARGEDLSLLHCGRCHVINARNRMSGLGSTPSFGVLRTLPDWDVRFEAFFSFNPHPAFTQIDGVTEPFGESRPPPIVPLALTLDELEAILAFVSELPPADLGAPILHQ